MKLSNTDLHTRIKYILKASHLKQKELASILDVSQSYVSGLCTGRNRGISPTLAERLENRLGYSAAWVLKGQGEIMAPQSRLQKLSATHRAVIALIDNLSEPQAKAVLAFIRTLPELAHESAN